MSQDTFESGPKPLTPQNQNEKDIWEATFKVRGIRGVRVVRMDDGTIQVRSTSGEILKDFVDFPATQTWLASFGFHLDLAWFHR